MSVVFVTGMSGTGKSTVLAELARRGYDTVDTDYGDWNETVPLPDGGSDEIWRADRIDDLLDIHTSGHLFISGTVSNQGRFYPRFDAVVLLSAPAEVILERGAHRDTNPHGQTTAERDRILGHLAEVEPLLRVTASTEIDARRTVADIADELAVIAGAR